MIMLAAAMVLLAQEKPVEQQKQEEKKEEKQEAKAAEKKDSGKEKAAPQYAGTETCAVCHEDVNNAFMKTPHGILEKSKKLKEDGHSCESCHGSGSEHADSGGEKAKIFSFKTSAPAQQQERCMKCHAVQATHAGSEVSAHARKGGPTCLECHSIHTGTGMTRLLIKPPLKLCLGCHSEQESQFRRPFHHKVLEGGMGCVSCHQPHGGSLTGQLKSADAKKIPCTRCHTDKSGPFVYDHPADTMGECQSCHEPHGSSNPKMLVRSTVAALCLECHSFTPNVPGSQPPSVHNLNSARFQNCTTCHVKIHGSNSSRLFLK
jgi:DmsE family decaheme c-type cytochrome